MEGIYSLNGKLYKNGSDVSSEIGLHIEYGYNFADSDKNGYAESVNFKDINVWYWGYLKPTDEFPSLVKVSGESVSDFVPGETTGAETGGYPAELLTIEQERADREKEAHRQLHGTGKMTITDVMGNTEEVTEGYYPAVREHKVLEAHESIFTRNNYEMLKEEFEASIDVNPDSLGDYIDLSTVTFDPMSYETLKTVFENNMPDLSGISISKNAWDIYKGNK